MKKGCLKFLFIFLILMCKIVAISQNVTQLDRINEYIKLADKAKAESDLVSQAHYYNKIAYEYWEANQSEQVIEYFSKSLAVNKDIGNTNALHSIYTSMGMIYSDIGEHQKALNAFEQSFDIIRSSNNKKEHVAGLLNIALALEDLKRYNDAIQRLEKALELAKELNNIRLAKKCFGRLAENYKQIGDSEKSFENMNLYTTYSSYVQKEEIKGANKKIEAVSEYAQQKEGQLNETRGVLKKTEQTLEEVEQISRQRQMEIDLLTKDKIIAELKIQEQQRKLDFERKIRIILILGITISTLLLSIIVFLYRRIIKQEKKLKISEAKFRTLFEDSQDSFLVLENADIIECNYGTVKMLGYYSIEEVVNLEKSKLYPENQPNGTNTIKYLDKKIHDAYLSGHSRFELVVLKANEDEFYIDVSLTSIHYIDRNVLFTIWRDVDQNKREHVELLQHRNELEDLISTRMKELQNSQLFLEEQNQIKAIFIATLKKYISHFLNSKKESVRAESKEFIQQYINEVDLIIEDNGLIATEISDIDVFDFLAEIKVMADSIIKNANVIINIQKHENVTDALKIDKEKVYYVINSILKNIVKYTETGEIKFRLYSNSCELIFSISDEGQIIKEEFVDDFFINQKLYLKSNDTNERVNSKELCLAYQFVQLMGGTMVVKSKKNEGTSFVFSLFE